VSIERPALEKPIEEKKGKRTHQIPGGDAEFSDDAKKIDDAFVQTFAVEANRNVEKEIAENNQQQYRRRSGGNSGINDSHL
jgi:hypothetical protein